MAKKKLEPNWDIFKSNLLKNSISSINETYNNYGKAVTEFLKYSGFGKDGRWIEYNGLREKMIEQKEVFYTELDKHLKIVEIVEEDNREAMLAILEGRF